MSSTQGFGGGFSSSLGSDGFGSGFGFSNIKSSIITRGLVLHYDIRNQASYPGTGALVTDLASSSNATLYGGVAYSDSYLQFDGSNDTLITNTSIASKVTTDITSIVMWAYPMDNGNLLSEVGSQALPNASGWHASVVEMVGGTMKFGLWNGLSISTITSSVSTPLNSWYQFTIVYDGTKLNAYVNGEPVGTNTFARANPVENGNGLYYAIAATDITNMGDGSYANMRLGQFLVYNVALTQEEVTQNFNGTKRLYGL